MLRKIAALAALVGSLASQGVSLAAHDAASKQQKPTEARVSSADHTTKTSSGLGSTEASPAVVAVNETTKCTCVENKCDETKKTSCCCETKAVVTVAPKALKATHAVVARAKAKAKAGKDAKCKCPVTKSGQNSQPQDLWATPPMPDMPMLLVSASFARSGDKNSQNVSWTESDSGPPGLTASPSAPRAPPVI